MDVPPQERAPAIARIRRKQWLIEAEIGEDAVVHSPCKALGILREQPGVVRVGEIAHLHQDGGHSGPSQHIEAGIGPHPPVVQAGGVVQPDEQLLSQIGGHAVQPIDIGFAAAGGGVGAGVAVEADKVLGAPAIGGVDPGGQTGGVAGSQLLGGGISGEANVEIGVRPQEIGQTDADIVGDILFPQWCSTKTAKRQPAMTQ